MERTELGCRQWREVKYCCTARIPKIHNLVFEGEELCDVYIGNRVESKILVMLLKEKKKALAVLRISPAMRIC